MAEVRGESALGLRERKKQRTRTTLIDAAVELCERQGFERTTVDQIAAIADVSPRTFSRYFATKDAIALALIDEAIDKTAAVLADQPTDISHFEALRRSYVAMYTDSKTALSGELTAERMMCTVRIILSSPALRQAVVEFRHHAVVIELAKRMGVGLDDRRLRLVSAIWSSILMNAMGDLGVSTDWRQIGVDDLVSRLEATYDEFIGLVADVPKPV
ncbi:TetR family transcriptional regulator [Mycobacterium sp.]|uniref:TetR family transcriptional regulator n=1 Tax=Mycobacterium sp. TaxID=1785 RepID=UPI002D9F2E3B|nr:TetR family transcriptional regulator [Mycobacterium sp.]